jgi:muramidase (phage lysozyme)
MSIISCESGFDPYAANPTSTARGLWQFLRGTWEWVQADSGLTLDDWPDGPYDPEQSTEAARWLKDAAGWTQWSCYGVGSQDWAEPVTVDLVPVGRPARS